MTIGMLFVRWLGRNVQGVQDQSRPEQVAHVFQSIRQDRRGMSNPTDNQLRYRQQSVHRHSNGCDTLRQVEFAKMLSLQFWNQVTDRHIIPRCTRTRLLPFTDSPVLTRHGKLSCPVNGPLEKWSRCLCSRWALDSDGFAAWKSSQSCLNHACDQIGHFKYGSGRSDGWRTAKALVIRQIGCSCLN